MARPSRGLTAQIVLRVDETLDAEADKIAKLLSRPEDGYVASKADAYRAAIRRGFAAIRAERRARKSSAG